METRTKRCLEIFKSVHELPGDVIELGCNYGHTSIPISQFIKVHKLKKKFYAYDSFEGLPYEGGDFNGDLKKGECHCTYDDFNKNVFDCGVSDIVVIVKGLIEDTLKLNNKNFCFAWLDMDLYESTSYSYKFLEDKIISGGIIGFHDYDFHRCPGIKKVVDEEVNKNKFVYHSLVDTCMFLRKI